MKRIALLEQGKLIVEVQVIRRATLPGFFFCRDTKTKIPYTVHEQNLRKIKNELGKIRKSVS